MSLTLRCDSRARRAAPSAALTTLVLACLASGRVHLIAQPPRPGPAVFGAAETKGGKHEARQVKGLVVAVEPSRITLQSSGGETVTLTTFEDYTDRVGVGAQVTAWYYPQDNGDKVLKTLDYPPESLLVPVGEIERRVHRVILLPSSEIPDADGLYDSMREYLRGSLGWYVAPQYLAEEIRKQSGRSGSMLDAMDPATGRFDMASYLKKSESVISKVASESRSDAVLDVRVIEVQAAVSRMMASWDGVEQPVAGSGMRTLAKLSAFSHKGEVPAATVELKLWDAKGKLLWRNRRGLALLEVMAGKELRQRPLSEFLADPRAVQEWLAAAFKSLGPSAPSLPAQ